MTPEQLTEVIPPLVDGERLTREEFHRRSEAMPEGMKVELIEGVVHMAAEAHHRRHGNPNGRIDAWLGVYEARTPGVEIGTGSTVMLDVLNEPQPDSLLFILPECGGQLRLSKDDDLEGPPELVVEVSNTTRRIDTGEKLDVYRRTGVKEYLIWRTVDRAIDWFVLRDEAFQRLAPAADGIHRSETFLGLWLDAVALLGGEVGRVHDVLALGLASPEHAAFVRRLAAARAASLAPPGPGA